MKPFRERNHTVIGVFSFAVIAAILLAAFRADRLPIIGGGDTYTAEFAEIGSLDSGAEVRVAGVSVGKVGDIELDGDKVKVEFTLDEGTDLGDQARAEIRIRTLLGAQYLALVPDGEGDLEKGATIPVDRTVPPYDVVEAFSELSTTTQELDVDQISDALTTLGDVSGQVPEEFQAALTGVSDLSRNLAARDEQINTLLQNIKKVTGVLNSRDEELVKLFEDADTLFSAVAARRDSIHALLVAATELSTELSTLVDETRDDLKPALTQLDAVTDMLHQHEASLDEALRLLPGFYRVYANALGTGPWFDVYLGNVPPNLGVADALRDALGGLGSGGEQ
ncbi:MCE family protein [Aeromicrobium sp. YIM 150415]|uniref:MCE family protein n=1 Tax=Aeromicrobium sp. YIM 150415 TaxID=2803912 RepID=UPI001966C45B|nr:MCE family protein [Aeromicrobium sp. YIM 150415]MBM9464869.1 MCE family protein [Aeromicrobium sp. YIM 150415]